MREGELRLMQTAVAEIGGQGGSPAVSCWRPAPTRGKRSRPHSQWSALVSVEIFLLCRTLGKLSPHGGRFAVAGAPAHHTQVFTQRFEVVGPAEAQMRPVAGDHPGKCFEEVVVIIAGMLKNDRARLLGVS
jgi:hypothetical protein